MLSASMIKAYQTTHYCVVDGAKQHVLKVGEYTAYISRLLASTPNAGERGAVFITAWNPFSEPLSERENRDANRALWRDLQTQGLAVHEGYGEGVNSSWCEESFLAWPLTRVQALQLCVRYRQNAVVFVEQAGMPELLYHPQAGAPD